MPEKFQFQCQECKNVKKLSEEEAKVGRWFECDYCGATYEITSIDEQGNIKAELVEEEK